VSIDVDVVSTRVTAVRDVVQLTGGPTDAVATYLPGRRVPGIRTCDGRLEIHAVVTTDRPVTAIADDIRNAVVPLADGMPVDVVIADVTVPSPT